MLRLKARRKLEPQNIGIVICTEDHSADALGKVLGRTQTAFENSLSKSSLADIVADIKP
jgi:hypothetical protein